MENFLLYTWTLASFSLSSLLLIPHVGLYLKKIFGAQRHGPLNIVEG